MLFLGWAFLSTQRLLKQILNLHQKDSVISHQAGPDTFILSQWMCFARLIGHHLLFRHQHKVYKSLKLSYNEIIRTLSNFLNLTHLLLFLRFCCFWNQTQNISSKSTHYHFYKERKQILETTKANQVYLEDKTFLLFVKEFKLNQSEVHSSKAFNTT